MDSFDFSFQLGIGVKLKTNLSIDFKFIDFSLTKTSFEFTDFYNNDLRAEFRNIGANVTLAYGFDL
jgi:hypothetical protein